MKLHKIMASSLALLSLATKISPMVMAMNSEQRKRYQQKKETGHFHPTPTPLTAQGHEEKPITIEPESNSTTPITTPGINEKSNPSKTFALSSRDYPVTSFLNYVANQLSKFNN